MPGGGSPCRGSGTSAGNLALILADQGASIVAVSDSCGGVYNADGLDVAAAVDAQADEHAPSTASRERRRSRTRSCSSSTATSSRRARSSRSVTAENADKVRAGDRLEGANGPVTPEADQILEERGVLVLPDVLANAGGVVVSYFEWVQGLQEYFWKEAEVNAKLNDIITRAFAETWESTRQRSIPCARPPT